MAIKNVSKDSVVYVPAYSDNRLSDNPLKVVMRPLSRGQADRYTKQVKYHQRKGGKQGEWDSNALDVQKKQEIAHLIMRLIMMRMKNIHLSQQMRQKMSLILLWGGLNLKFVL